MPTDRLESGAVSDLPALAAEGATVDLDGTTLLPPTTFSVMPGEFRCLTGGNGSGKTTLLRAFLGSRRLTDGAVLVHGEPVDMTRPRHRRLVASLVEPVPVARDMTLREQVTLVAASWYGNTATTAERADEIIGRLGLTPLDTRFPSQLSSGQLQLFHLALTLVRPADVVLLDEPERHLDTDRVALVGALLAERAREGTAFLVATHEPALVKAGDGVMELG
ncbi:ATP-binding cassette domain-containing protein [Streptomyces sp. NPDC042898]|uniref:ABC transporter ATP-binding protein n=1 Tax=Streptomyces sp. NPDC042898 TaxID=3154334 RepID=UPI0033CF0230